MRFRPRPCRTSVEPPRRRRRPRAPGGTARAAERMADEFAEKRALMALFRRFSSAALYGQSRAGRGLALRRYPPSLCARSLSQRRRRGRPKLWWRPKTGPALLIVTQCWSDLMVFASAGTCRHGYTPRRGRVSVCSEYRSGHFSWRRYRYIVGWPKPRVGAAVWFSSSL